MSKIILSESFEGRPIYNGDSTHGVDLALAETQKNKLTPLYMNKFLKARSHADKDHEIWTQWYYTTTAKATGMAGKKEGILYIHKPNPLCNPKNISDKIKTNKIKDGAVLGFERQFKKFLKEVDYNAVFLVYLEDINQWPDGLYGIDEPTKEHMRDYKGKIKGIDMIAINHPQAKPFGVTEDYLSQHKKVVGSVIGMGNIDDYVINTVAWRLLAADDRYDNGYLLGDVILDDVGRFFGVQDYAEGGAKIIRSPLEGLAGKAKEVPGKKLLILDGADITPEQYELLKPK